MGQYDVDISTFIYYFSPFFERREEGEERAKLCVFDIGSSSKSCRQIEFHETHSALWWVTAKIEYTLKGWSKFKRKPFVAIMAPYFLSKRAHLRVTYPRRIELVGFYNECVVNTGQSIKMHRDLVSQVAHKAKSFKTRRYYATRNS